MRKTWSHSHTQESLTSIILADAIVAMTIPDVIIKTATYFDSEYLEKNIQNQNSAKNKI